MFLVCGWQTSQSCIQRFTPKNALKRGTQIKTENFTNNLHYLGNGARCDVSYHYSNRSCTWAFHLYQKWHNGGSFALFNRIWWLVGGELGNQISVTGSPGNGTEPLWSDVILVQSWNAQH